MNISKFFLIFFSLIWGILGCIILLQSKEVGAALKYSTIALGVLTWFSLLFVTYNIKYDINIEEKKKD